MMDGCMPRLNFTLDRDTFRRLETHARKARCGPVTLAKRLIRDALDRREADQRRRKLALDYARQRNDAYAFLRELQIGELDLLD
jgi:hypothetical protein